MSEPTRAAAPKILCSTVSLFSRPIDEAFSLLSECGFDGVELMVTKDPDTQDPKRLKELSERNELPIEAIHAPFLLMTRSVWGTDPIGKIDRAVALAEDLGASLVVVHPPYRWQMAYRRWLDRELPFVLDRTDVRVAVENMFPVRIRGRRVGTFHARQSLEDLEGFEHVVLDTSHAAVAGLDLFEALARLGERVSHIHLSNNAGRGWDSHLPLDQGVLPMGRFLDALAADGFSGSISLELDLRRYANDADRLRQVLVQSRGSCGSRLLQAV